MLASWSLYVSACNILCWSSSGGNKLTMFYSEINFGLWAEEGCAPWLCVMIYYSLQALQASLVSCLF